MDATGPVFVMLMNMCAVVQWGPLPLTHMNTLFLCLTLSTSLWLCQCAAKKEEQTDNKWGGELSTPPSLLPPSPHYVILTHTSAPLLPTSWPRESKKGAGQGRHGTFTRTERWLHFTLVSMSQVVSRSEFTCVWRRKCWGRRARTVRVRRRKWSAVDRWAEVWGQVKRQRMKEVESGKAAERSER